MFLKVLVVEQELRY